MERGRTGSVTPEIYQAGVGQGGGVADDAPGYLEEGLLHSEAGQQN